MIRVKMWFSHIGKMQGSLSEPLEEEERIQLSFWLIRMVDRTHEKLTKMPLSSGPSTVTGSKRNV
jgi:hypothetical protein